MKDNGLYPDVPWDDLEAIYEARLDKQTKDIHWVAHALRPDHCGPATKLPTSIFESVRRYCSERLSPVDAEKAVREFTHFRLKSGGPFGVATDPTGKPEPLFVARSLVYDPDFKPAIAWRCLRLQGSTLAKIAVKVLDTLANSVPSEWSFSANGHVHTLTRNRLSVTRADQQTFVYVNSRVFTRITDSSSKKKLWADLQEKEWLELEDSYLDLFRDAHGRQQYMGPGDYWYGAMQATGDIVGLGTELGDEDSADEAIASPEVLQKRSKKRKTKA